MPFGSPKGHAIWVAHRACQLGRTRCMPFGSLTGHAIWVDHRACQLGRSQGMPVGSLTRHAIWVARRACQLGHSQGMPVGSLTGHAIWVAHRACQLGGALKVPRQQIVQTVHTIPSDYPSDRRIEKTCKQLGGNLASECIRVPSCIQDSCKFVDSLARFSQVFRFKWWERGQTQKGCRFLQR